MLYEVTLHPSVFDRSTDRAYWNGVAHVLQGMAANCILASLWNGGLFAELIRRLRSIDHATADKLRRLLDRLKDLRRIHPRPPAGTQVPQNNPEWLTEALLSHRQAPLFAIVAREACVNGTPGAQASGVCVPVEDAGMNALWNGRTHTQQVPRCLACVLPCLAPILSRSRKVILVDYVIGEVGLEPRRARSAQRFCRSISECLRSWGQGTRRRTEFIIDTEVPRNSSAANCRAAFLAWRGALRPVLPADGSTVKMRFWSSTATCNFQRNRFLLSEIAALKLGKGFDLFPGTTARQTDNITLLDDAAARIVESEFAQLRLEGEFNLR
ncbi:MAG: hypothetical protein GXY83_03345 [Rhodopirellula sp.]|nr:hypothetical protein [Rhodopirellula sp.]